MNDRPLVSIILNNYNYGHFLNQAIDSTLSQTYPQLEVIVVDDGSTDNSQEIITDYGKRIIPVLKKNGGQASALNAGFLVSKGNIICFLDSDDIFVNEKILEVVNVFNSYPEINWCFHTLKLVDKNTGYLLGLSRESSSRLCDFRLQMKKGNINFSPPPTSGLCFRRSLLEQIMPIPEAFWVSADRYLRYAALALSQGFFLDQELTLQGIHSNNLTTLKEDKQRQKIRAIVTAYFLRKNFPYLSKFTNQMFARGLSAYWLSKVKELEYKELIKSYLSTASLREKLEIGLIAVYQSRPGEKRSFYRMPDLK